mmetsp:Transcript_4761/g.7925  ORF Transcript_4761/g.7925 Transcript_4761/m.7925 type:complete len:443 (+) Transcript_4761:50-1378(+)
MAGRGRGGRGQGSPRAKMEIDPRTGTPVCGVAGSKKKDVPLASPPPPPVKFFGSFDRGSKEYEETMGALNDGFSVDKSLAENVVASAHFVYSIISKMKCTYQEERRGEIGDYPKLCGFNTLVRELKISVSRLADSAIDHHNKSFPANDFLQRIETDDIRASVGTKLDILQKEVTEVKALLGQKSLPKGQHFPPKTSSVAPSSVWNNSYFKLATAAAPSPTTTNSFLPSSKHGSPAGGEPPAVGEEIYNNALCFYNAEVNENDDPKIFFQNLINERLLGRMKPLSLEDIDEVVQSDKSSSTVFFSDTFHSVSTILENYHCFSGSNSPNSTDKVYISPLLSPWEVNFVTKARKTAYQLCKNIHKDMAWWRTIKINESGYSLKIKIFSADVEDASPPRTVRLSLKGLRSTNDPTFKAKLVDLISKVKCTSRADDLAECEDNDSSL